MLEITPALTADQLDETVRAIASVQHASGAVPETIEGVINPWNHIEALMALDVGGLTDEAVAGYRWLMATQRPDGAWASNYLGAEIVDRTLDTNFTSYVAFGSWHHFRATGDRGFLEESWPMIERAIGFTLELQKPDGTIAWARNAKGRAAPNALLTSCACIYMSLRSAIEVAEALGYHRPDWELAWERLGNALRGPEAVFAPKDRFSMDWYYPILAGVLDVAVARGRLHRRWDRFVEPTLGARCVSDKPWITAGETAELALALHVAEMPIEANRLLEWVQHLRAEDGAYWIGATFPDGTVWPRQKPTWGSGAVVLAADVLAGGPTASCL